MSSHPVIVFDGVCNLCATSVRFVIERDPARAFRFAPMQSDTGAGLMRRYDLDPADVDTFVLVEGGRAHLRSEAALRVARRLRWPWRLAWVFRFVPRGLRDRCYDAVARNRYAWFGRRASCMVPTPDVQARFLD